MRRSALKPGAPLKRKTRIRARRVKPRRGPARSPEYRAWLRTLNCSMRLLAGHVCRGRMTCSHVGYRGLSQKCSDYEAIPMCWDGRLIEWTEARGAFAGWTLDARRTWAAQQVAFYQSLYAARGFLERTT